MAVGIPHSPSSFPPSSPPPPWHVLPSVVPMLLRLHPTPPSFPSSSIPCSSFLPSSLPFSSSSSSSHHNSSSQTTGSTPATCFNKG